ncbi:hypothetical protein HMPREF9968_0013 [Streptococcus oralis SK255]|uniref:Uncharacterized protein n=1 Tax=Streptococcus oralis SK255 TaxID=1005704 RepID=F5VWD1_STROR|nr:hypothetical protein HMPREF9968_0013 [Streptococcus oralis SK255]
MTNSYLDDRTFSSLIDTAYVAQIFNLLLVLYQHLVLHLHPDFTNGIFGFTNYANGIQGFYCLALSILSIVYYLYGKWKAMKSLILIAISCIICALAEIKYFFVIFIFSIFLIFIFQKSKAVRKARIISTSVGISLLFWLPIKLLKWFCLIICILFLMLQRHYPMKTEQTLRDEPILFPFYGITYFIMIMLVPYLEKVWGHTLLIISMN